MTFRGETIKIAAVCITLVILLSGTVFMINAQFPGRSTLLFLAWAFVAVPVILLVTGAVVAKAAYYSCMGPNESVASAAVTGLISTFTGITLWVLIGTAARFNDPVSMRFGNMDFSSILELGVLVFMYTFMSAVGGVVYYFVAHGRMCKNIIP